MFKDWLSEQKVEMAELERMRMEADEDDQLVGPQLPDQYRAGGGGSNYGGALRPGEGERWVWVPGVRESRTDWR